GAIALDVKRETFFDVCGLAYVEARVGKLWWPPILVFDIHWPLTRAFQNYVTVCGQELSLLANPPESVNARLFR
ncbi:MAG: hypothetical protein ACKVQK_22160, partial [Burkholderiales bacterium]